MRAFLCYQPLIKKTPIDLFSQEQRSVAVDAGSLQENALPFSLEKPSLTPLCFLRSQLTLNTSNRLIYS